jgi:hypothetical protein
LAEPVNFPWVRSCQLLGLGRYGWTKNQIFVKNAMAASVPNSQASERNVGCFVSEKRIATAHAANVTNPTLGKSLPYHAAKANLSPETKATCWSENQPFDTSHSGAYNATRRKTENIISAARDLTAPPNETYIAKC